MPGKFDKGAPREMHDAVCSECKNACQVPFKPTEGKPIYCRDCYAKKKPTRFQKLDSGGLNSLGYFLFFADLVHRKISQFESESRRMKQPQCPHKPEELKGQPIGMYHCPICGEMVLAGVKHPNY